MDFPVRFHVRKKERERKRERDFVVKVEEKKKWFCIENKAERETEPSSWRKCETFFYFYVAVIFLIQRIS